MKTFDQMSYHPTSEKLVEILCHKAQNNNPLFFRVIVGYYFSKIAAAMRATIATHDRGDIPVNMYALNLSPSGTGKGVSTGIMENEVTHLFRNRWKEETFPVMAEKNLPKIALRRATRKGTDPDEEIVRVEKEFNDTGEILFDFSDATTPAVKQMRHKLLMAECGSVNLEIDEIGSNLLGQQETLTAFLELYDKGRTKPKLTKNTSDSKRNEDIEGWTPTNLLMFGEPSKLLNGGKQEEELYSMLQTGYARRCFFGYSRAAHKNFDMTPEEIYNQSVSTASSTFLEQLANQLEALADSVNANRRLMVSKDTSLLVIEYRLKCEKEAAEFPEHDEIKKHELSHRYFKALKLAGAYAFVDNSPELTAEHFYQAVKLAEESGESFQRLLTRDRPHVKLAKYIASCRGEVTHADLAQDLPFYRGARAGSEMLTLAIAWGYKNNVIIKKAFNDGIEFLRGETLKETDLSQMPVAYSTDIAVDYRNEKAPWDKLHVLTQNQGLHWTSHHLVGGHRTEENAIPGFSLVVVDVDGGVNISTAKLLLQGYKYLIYTTKRHTQEDNRFRIILPINYELKLDARDFKEFMSNIYDWLPFEVDKSTGQRARKWLSHDGHFEYNEGELLDALPFIPKTSKNEERKALLNSQQSMDNLERWVCNNIGDGNRNNMLLRYAMILLDAGFDFDGIRTRVMSLNEKIADKLPEIELMSTVMVTVGKRIAQRGLVAA